MNNKTHLIIMGIGFAALLTLSYFTGASAFLLFFFFCFFMMALMMLGMGHGGNNHGGKGQGGGHEH